METMPAETDDVPETRAGYVTLLGRPNSGKSTLLNALVGEHLSIVTPRPQTTWRRVAGIRTGSRTQIVFLDTPGLLHGQSLMDRALIAEARRALDDADVLLLVLDPVHPLGDRARETLREMAATGPGALLAMVNKIDVGDAEGVAAAAAWGTAVTGRPALLGSALRGRGLDELLQALESLLPPSPFLYPEDEIASAPVRFFVEELVREAVFELYHDEVPYAVFARVEEFREQEPRTYIQVNLFAERASQKAILIGRRGEAIRKLGETARERIERFLDRPVYLDLWVKVLPRWRKKRGQLRRFGLPAPADHAVPT